MSYTARLYLVPLSGTSANHLDKGNIFDRAKRLRDKMELSRDNGTTSYLEFLNTEHWGQNEYQVTNQITQQGKYKNRYDGILI